MTRAGQRRKGWVGLPRARWQYGVRFADGSIAWWFNGRTARQRAEAMIAEYPGRWPDQDRRNPPILARRAVDHRGRPLQLAERRARKLVPDVSDNRCKVIVDLLPEGGDIVCGQPAVGTYRGKFARRLISACATHLPEAQK